MYVGGDGNETFLFVCYDKKGRVVVLAEESCVVGGWLAGWLRGQKEVPTLLILHHPVIYSFSSRETDIWGV